MEHNISFMNSSGFNLVGFSVVCTKILLTLFVTILFSNHANALPWDTDLYNQPSFKSNEIARAPVKGTVPLGAKPFTMTIDEADGKLENPVKFEKSSLLRGQRLWNAQCSACHGKAADSNAKVGKLVGAPNLLEPRFKSYSDGKLYATIVYGIRGMPRYGYKISDIERWDVVNYLHFLQGKTSDLSNEDLEIIKKPATLK